MLVGLKSRTCETNGFWSDKPPTCKFIDCGDLQNFDNGIINLVDKRTTHGAVANYSCKDNFTLVGDAQRRCGDGGIWSGHQPQCLCKNF